MVRHAVITGAGLPVVQPFAFELLRQQLRSLTLCSDLTDLSLVQEALLACQQQQAPETRLAFCSFSEANNRPSLQGALEHHADTLLLHGRTRRSPSLTAANPCDAVHHNLLLTRQVLQVVLATRPRAFVLLSSDQALHTRTVLGASLAAAEASVLEAARFLGDVAIAVVRFPACLDPMLYGEAVAMDRAWRQDAAARAALQVITGTQRHVLISWPQPLAQPQELTIELLTSAIHPPKVPLLTWLQRISSPLQAYDKQAVSEALLDLWNERQ